MHRILFAVMPLGALVWAQSDEKVKARELFFTAPAPLSQPAKADSKKSSKKTATQTPVQRPDNTGTASRQEQQRIEPVSSTLIPLGLSYRVTKRGSDGKFRDVDPESTFRSGDAIRIKVSANDTGYLYIVMQGSSGTWRPLFPAQEIEAGDNRVIRGREYEIPSSTAFVFDEQPGEEKLFLMLTRQPESDFEQVIYSMQRNTTEGDRDRKMLASAGTRINDSVVDGVRGKVLARDLVFEKVEQAAADDKKDITVYVVDKSRRPDSKLIADLKLKHE